MNLYQKSARLYEFIHNSCQFMFIFWRFYLAYLAQATQVDIPTPIYDPKTRICPWNQKKNLKNPKFPPILKIPFLRNVNLRKIMILNFDSQPNVIYALKWCTLLQLPQKNKPNSNPIKACPELVPKVRSRMGQS